MKRNDPSPLNTMAVDHNAPNSLFIDALFCEEEDERLDFEEEEESKSEFFTLNKNKLTSDSLYDYWCCDDEQQLQSLLRRERETSLIRSTRSSSSSRKQAVEFILRINSHHGFAASAAVFAVNFLDRFLSGYCLSLEKDKPWLMQLVAVASLSLAAKVEETHVPLLVDLQLEDAKYYLFDGKTIQRMELLILSALKWRMNPVTPLSFIHHIVARLGFKSYVFQLEFLKSCENTILSIISDSRFVRYNPSVLASATVLHVVDQVEYNAAAAVECEKAIFHLLKLNKEEVEECYGFVLDVVSSKKNNNNNGSKRRKWELSWNDEAIDAAAAAADMKSEINANDSWQLSSSSSSSSSQSPCLKKHKST